MILAADLPMLHRLIRLDPIAGRLFWRQRSPEDFPNNTRVAAWNAQFAGKEALTADNGKGYRHGNVLGRTMKAHHVVWALANGSWPEDHIDHINGDRSDNRPANLRVVSNAENQRNKRLQCNNKSGTPGVLWMKRNRKWAASISVNGGRVHLGLFDERRDAVFARQEAERENAYHANHGRRA